jgi:hypothetical protein
VTTSGKIAHVFPSMMILNDLTFSWKKNNKHLNNITDGFIDLSLWKTSTGKKPSHFFHPSVFFFDPPLSQV